MKHTISQHIINNQNPINFVQTCHGASQHCTDVLWRVSTLNFEVQSRRATTTTTLNIELIMKNSIQMNNTTEMKRFVDSCGVATCHDNHKLSIIHKKFSYM